MTYHNARKIDPPEVKFIFNNESKEYQISRAFNITLCSENIQKFPQKEEDNSADDNDVIFKVKKEGDKTYYYRYYFQKENPSVLLEKKYDVAYVLNVMDKWTEDAKKEINEILDSPVYLEFFEEYKSTIVLEKTEKKANNYLRTKGLRQTWTKSCEDEISILPDSISKINLDSLSIKELEHN